MSLLEATVSGFINRKLAQPSTTAPHPEPGTRSLAKGLLAGLVAGVVATAAKTLVGQIYPPRIHGEPEPPSVLADKVADKLAGHELAPVRREAATETIHWVFGATAGAAYGALAEFYPAATSRDGINFGMTLMALTHESTLPAMGLSPAPANQTTREKTSEMASHVVYGLVAETTRRLVRKML